MDKLDGFSYKGIFWTAKTYRQLLLEQGFDKRIASSQHSHGNEIDSSRLDKELTRRELLFIQVLEKCSRTIVTNWKKLQPELTSFKENLSFITSFPFHV